MATKQVTLEVRGSTKKLKRDLRRAEKNFKTFGKKASRDLKRSFSKIKGTLKSAVGIGGVVGFAALGKEVFDFEKKLTRLGIQGNKSAADMAAMRDRFAEVSKATGNSREKLVDAAAQFVSLTGDMDTASKSMQLFGEISTATGADLSDVAKTAASLKNNLGITEVNDMRAAFSGMAAQGKAGAIELRDLATLLPGLAPQFVKFEEKGVTALRSLGANLQIVRNNFGSAEEAATGMRGLMTALIKKSGKFKALGINVFQKGPDGKKTLRNFQDIVKEIDRAGLSQDKLLKTFGRTEGFRAFLALQQAGIEGFEKFNIEGFKGGTIAKDFEKFNKSAAGRMQKAWNEVKETLLKLFTPQRIENFVKIAEKLGKVVAFVADNAVALAAAWAGMKIGGIALQFHNLGSKVEALGGNLGRTTKILTGLGGAFAVFSIGMGIAEALRLSERLEKSLLSIEQINNRTQVPTFVTREDRGTLEVGGGRQRITTDAAKRQRIEERTVQQAEEMGLGRGQAGRAQKLRNIAAREAGFLNFAQLQEGDVTGGEQTRRAEARAEELGRRILSAQESVLTRKKTAGAAQAIRDINVKVAVDPQGLLNVFIAGDRKGRRKVTP